MGLFDGFGVCLGFVVSGQGPVDAGQARVVSLAFAGDLAEIVRIQLRELAGRAEGLGIKLEVSEAAEAWLAARGYDPDYGARPLRRVLQRELGDRLAVLLLEGAFHAGDTVQIGPANDQPSFQ